MEFITIENISTLLLLMPTTITDIFYKKIWMLWPALFGIEAILLIVFGVNSIKFSVVGMIPGIILLIAGAITKEQIGYGDGYLTCVMGALLGLNRIIMVLIGAMFMCCFVGMYFIICKKCGRKKTLPFVPFMLISFVLCTITG